MCASCVSQGALYLGGSLATLRVMAHRAGRRRPTGDEPSDTEAAPAAEPASAPGA